MLRTIVHTVLLVALFYPAFAQESKRDFHLDFWESKSYTPPEQTKLMELNSGSVSHKVELFSNDSIAPFLPTHLGLNTTFRSGSEMLTERLNNYKNSNMGAYRFPAGSGSNIYFWDGVIPDEFLIEINPIDANQNWVLKVSEFATFIDSLNVRATVNVNYFYARYGVTQEGTREARVNQAAAYAAGFVNYLNNELKAGIKHWEIGNECYGQWEEGYNVNGSIVTGKEYGEDLRVFAEKMKEADPSIKIGAVMYPKSDEWNDQVMKEVKDHADHLIVHNYFTGFNDATVENILASTVQVEEIKKQMEACILRNTEFDKDHFPVFMTEYNCRGPHTTTFINACFTADVIGKLIENNYGLATRWVGEWKWKEGTHGLFALEDPDQEDYSVRQAYMIYHYFGKCFGDKMVKSATNNKQLTVFGSSFSDGKTGLVVINPTAERQHFNISFGEEAGIGKAYLYEVYANSIEETDKKFWVNEHTSTTPGGGPDDVQNIAPYEIDYNESSIFEAKKYSVSFYVFDNSILSSSKKIKNDERNIIFFPVPAKNELHISSSEVYKEVEIYSTSGTQLVRTQFHSPIDISDLSNGMYIVNLLSDTGRFTKSFIKQN